MKTYATMAVLVSALMIAGCVSKDKYLASTAEAESIKADLEKARAQKNALDQQMKSLKDANAKLTADSEFMSAELQRIKADKYDIESFLPQQPMRPTDHRVHPNEPPRLSSLGV